jgi:prolyl 4-hydroxylase
MSIMDEVERLASGGEPGKGINLIENAARSGHGEALYILANWRLWGLYGPRDLPAVHALLARAERAGWTEAAPLRAYLVGNGTGCASDPERARAMLEAVAATNASAAAQIALLDRMAPASSLGSEVLSVDPDVRIVRKFLSEAECDYLTSKAGPLLRPSMILDPRTGRPRPHPIRTSSSMNFDPANEDLVIHAVNRRIAASTATGIDCGEPLHVLRYEPGQEYRPHLDTLPSTANQRQWTALIYLNDDFEGGETAFPKLGLTVRGSKGDCLLFRVVFENAQSDPRLLHAGLPVGSGVKWLASRWIRQMPYEAEVLRS